MTETTTPDKPLGTAVGTMLAVLDALECESQSARPLSLEYEISEDLSRGYIHVALPAGTRPSDVRVHVEAEQVVVSVDRPARMLGEHETLILGPLPSGRFTLKRPVPTTLFDLSTLSAKLSWGLLVLTFQKRPEHIRAEPERVTVLSNEPLPDTTPSTLAVAS